MFLFYEQTKKQMNRGSDLVDSVNLLFFSREVTLLHKTFGINFKVILPFEGSINGVSHEITCHLTFWKVIS